MSIRISITALAVILLVSCSDGGRGPAGRMVDIGTHRLYAVVRGQGSPAVVIDGGIGADSEEYRPLQDSLAERTTVVTYDRAGYGRSGAGPLPRDARTEAGELRALLEMLGVPGPYIIVGHSLGGLNAEVYADLYPDDVAGMVLLDPPPLGWLAGERYAGFIAMAEQMTAQWQAIADRGGDSEDEDERREAVYFMMLASEHREMLDSSARQAVGIESFGDLPVVVIASGVPNPLFGDDAAGYQEYWIDQSRAVAEKSTRGKFILAEQSTHRLHADAEELVVESVFSLLDDIRSGPR